MGETGYHKEKDIHSVKSMIYRVNMGSWIRCNERLPEKSGTYLVCVGYVDSIGETYAVMEGCFVREEDSASEIHEWYFTNRKMCKNITTIVAWLEEEEE